MSDVKRPVEGALKLHVLDEGQRLHVLVVLLVIQLHVHLPFVFLQRRVLSVIETSNVALTF